MEACHQGARRGGCAAFPLRSGPQHRRWRWWFACRSEIQKAACKRVGECMRAPARTRTHLNLQLLSCLGVSSLFGNLVDALWY